MFFEPAKVNQTMWGPDDPSNNNILEHVETFMQSMGVSYSYWADENVIRYTALYRISNGDIGLATLPDDGGPRYVVMRPSFSFGWYGGDVTSYSSSLDGGQCYAEGPLTITRRDEINRIQADWRDRHQSPQPWGDWSTIEPANMPQDQPIRLYRFTSWLDDGVYLDPTVANLLNIAQNEGSIPPHPQLEWDTRLNGGFHKWSDARHFLACWEWAHFTYLGRSRYAQWMGLLPVFGRIGGRVHFDGQHWRIGMRLAYARPNNWGPFATLTWSYWQERVKWDPSDGWASTDRFLHPSISWADLANVSNTTQFQNY